MVRPPHSLTHSTKASHGTAAARKLSKSTSNNPYPKSAPRFSFRDSAPPVPNESSVPRVGPCPVPLPVWQMLGLTISYGVDQRRGLTPHQCSIERWGNCFACAKLERKEDEAFRISGW